VLDAIKRRLRPARRWLQHAPLIGSVLQRRQLDARSKRAVPEAWEASLAGEIRFWDERLRQPSDALLARCDPNTPLQPELASLIDAPQGSTIRILDCGAGPLTFVGKIHPGYVLEIDAVDVLAEEYRGCLERAQIAPPVMTRACATERLDEMFDADRFDIVCARNTLDHSYDPIAAILQMIRCTKPGGAVLLQHARNVAIQEQYLGMHQWNFVNEGDDVRVWRPGQETRLSTALAAVASIEKTWTTETKRAEHPMQHVVLRKHS
jgi:SAM-dependent methyltransferase